VYADTKGKPLTDSQLARVISLVIPPAWTNVWICPSLSGHLQVTGRDQKGRKQAIYHPDWHRQRSVQKFDHLHDFGMALPKIRSHVQKELATRGLSREKILAAVVQLLDTTLIRIGNQRYEKENKSYGLTTLRNKHVNVVADRLEFNFVGKSGKAQMITLKNRTLCSIVRKCQELPGQHLFTYMDSEGVAQGVTSTEVNSFLQSISQEATTAKEFRTWGGTIEAVRLVRDMHPTTHRDVAAIVKGVAQKLGNTPAVCRAHYIHPVVLDLAKEKPWIHASLPRRRKYHDPMEILFLEKICRHGC